jgi:hypothetical protein
MTMRVGVVGKIVSGDERGAYVKIVDDSEDTGGYLILTSMYPDFRDGNDNWVENRDVLVRFLKESKWIIEWNLTSSAP